MSRRAAFAGMAREPAKGVSSVACLAFVAVLALAFWAGALWFGSLLIQLFSA
ncbi:hypothetical protein [Phenylobacterium aquaticum]|uniref:hypothetical protein n=1 Tax=Phenylobacterium aquaticum TaxID=1763816 RepID=UPI0026ED072F|nr:hypothetical protein [Phenylobacterium aquaticum]